MTELKIQSVNYTNGALNIDVQVTPVNFENDQNFKAFVNVTIKKGEELHAIYNSMQLVKSPKSGHFFLAEPKKNYKDKDGNWKSQVFYLLPAEVKKDILAHMA